MLAVSCDNFAVLIVDTDTRRIVRTFKGHTNQVTDMVGVGEFLSLIHTSFHFFSPPSPSFSPSALMDGGWSAQPWTVVSEHGTFQLAGKHSVGFWIYMYTNYDCTQNGPSF